MRQPLFATLIILAACGPQPKPVAPSANNSAERRIQLDSKGTQAPDSTHTARPGEPCPGRDGPAPDIILSSTADIRARVPPLHLDSAGLLNVPRDTTHGYFVVRPFIDSVLAKAKLRSFLKPREERLSWLGMNHELYLSKNDDFPVPGAAAVQKLGNCGLLRFADSSYAFFFTVLYGGGSERGPYLLFFDKKDHYRDGFECAAHLGNRHGATRLETRYLCNGRFHASIDDWAEMENPNGHHVSAGLKWNGQQLVADGYRVTAMK
ncbi:hypothetical protein [Flaviaesturariibacter terrae]